MFQQKLRVWTPEIQQAHNEQRMARGGDPGGAGKRGKRTQEMKQWEMNPIAGAVKRGADYASNLLDQGPSVRDVTSNLVGAIPFVGPDLRKAMEGSTTTVPVGLNMASNMPEEGYQYGEPAKYKKAGIETYKMPTTDLLDAMKVSDLTGTAGLSRAAESAGYGEAPDLFDVLDTAGVGAGLYGAAKLGAKGAKMAGKGALKALEQAGTGPRSGSMAAQRGAVKLGGGNWVDSETNRAIGKLKADESYPQSAIASAKEDLAEYAKNPNMHPESVTESERLKRDLAHMEETNAYNKWLDTKVGGYVRNQMATPDDPVVKMLDTRAAKIESDYATGQNRLAKLDERIAQAEATASTTEERNNLANMKRTRAQRAAEVESDRELAMNAMLPEGKDFVGYDALRDDINEKSLSNYRKEQGFPEEGYAKTSPGKAWEAAADVNVAIRPAERFQGQEEKLAALRAAEKELNQYQKVELPDKFKKHLDSTELDEGSKQKLIQNSPSDLMANIIGEREKRDQLNQAYRQARDKADVGSFAMAEDNPYLTKLAPDTPVYRTGHLPNLGIDHIIDVLKDDVATGKLKLEDLNKITMDQAVKRAGEYDFEMAKKARDAAATSRASMPVHKEYPEGYKWVQLTKPGEFNSESNAMGHSVRGYEPEKGHPDWTPESGDSGREDYGHGGWEAIKSGRAKVYSLVDPSGKPHTTIEVKQNPNPYPVSGEAFTMLPSKTKAEYGQYVREWRQRNPDIEELTDENVTQALKEAGVKPQPDIITQIKGKGNARPQEKYDKYTQDFVRSGNWSDVNELKNTGLYPVNKDYLGHLSNYTPAAPDVQHLKKQQRMEALAKAIDAGDLPDKGYVTRDEWEEALRKHGRPTYGEDTDELLKQLQPPEEGMKSGGEVHMSIGGDMVKAVKAAKTAKAVAEAKSALPAPAVIPNLLKKSTASEIGREERARRQAAGAAEEARVAAAKQMPMPIGYVKHTEKSPNPHVGYRYETVQHPGIQEPIPIDLAKLEREKKGASLGVIPWDSQSRNVEVSSISGEPLTIHLDTHGGQPYALDEKHLEELIGGSSSKEIADAIKERDKYAIKENLEKGGTGEVLHAVTTMGKYGENYSHTPSEFAFELINRRLQEGRLSNKDLDYLNNLIRIQQDKKIQRDKGIFPYANFAGFETPEGLEQIYKGGLGLQTSAGNLRKAIAENLHKVKQQELLGFNSEDFINATSEPSLRGVDKGYIGGTLLSNDIGSAGFYGPRKDRFGMELAPSSGFPYESPYSTDFSARYYGQLPEMIPLDVVMHRQLAPLEQGFLARPNKKPYTEKSLRNAAIGSLEKSNKGVSQIMDDQFFQDLSDYMEALKKPLEKKKGGLAQAKKPKKVARHGNTVSN